MTLHILSSANPSKLLLANDTLQPKDALLLLGDGVYQLPSLTSCVVTEVLYYVRESDLLQRGLNLSFKNVTLIDDAQWVALTLEHSPIITWHD